jgi:hypothetical protein
MPHKFLQSLLVIPKDQLHLYRLHKIVLYEYNKYIDETCESVKNISIGLPISDTKYSYVKNKERKSRNLFPSFRNKLNEILLNYADKFGFEKQPGTASLSQPPQPGAASPHQKHQNKNGLKKKKK